MVVRSFSSRYVAFFVSYAPQTVEMHLLFCTRAISYHVPLADDGDYDAS